MTAVFVVVPDGIDDPMRPSGGNAYERRSCQGLTANGGSIHEHTMPGQWPRPDAGACAALRGVTAGLLDGAVVLLDGLVASSVPEVLVPEAGRLRLVVLVHMPLGERPPGEGLPDAGDRERAVLSAADAVVRTSTWTRRWLLDQYALPPGRVDVAEPGVDAADLAPGTPAGGELLCVAAVTPGKGHDVLLAALGTLTDLSRRCVCVGSRTRDPVFADRLVRQALDGGIGDRVCFTGSGTGADLGLADADADVLVPASRAETYGMVVTQALARGLPVLATAVGGLPEPLGHGAAGSRPGLLVPPGDPAALAAALRRWLGDAELRQQLRKVAGERRLTLPRWSAASVRIAGVLSGVAP